MAQGNQLRRHEVEYAEKTQGIFISMDINEKAEKIYLREEATTFAAQTKTRKANKNACLYTYNASFMKTMEYSMAVTQFSEAEWNSIVAPALQISLQKGGMSKHFLLAVFYGPEYYQCFHVMHPYFNQEVTHITTHVQESVNRINGSQTAKLLQGSAEAFRLELGLPFTLGTVKYDNVAPYLSDCWYKCLFKFVSKQPLEVIEDYPEVPTLRVGDSYIMQAFIDAEFRNKDLHLLNIMQMAFKVVTVADILLPRMAERSFKEHNVPPTIWKPSTGSL